MVEYEAFDVFATAAQDSLVAAQGVQVRGSFLSSFAWGLTSGQQVLTPYVAAMLAFFTALPCCMYHHNEHYCTLLACCCCTCRVICSTASHPKYSRTVRSLFSRYRLNHDVRPHGAIIYCSSNGVSCTALLLGTEVRHCPPRIIHRLPPLRLRAWAQK